MKARIGGVFFLAMALVLVKLSIFDVLSSAAQGSGKISIFSKAIALVPLCLVFGGVMLVGGDPGLKWLQGISKRGPDGKLTKNLLIFVVILLVPGLALWGWLAHRLAQLGYH